MVKKTEESNVVTAKLTDDQLITLVATRLQHFTDKQLDTLYAKLGYELNERDGNLADFYNDGLEQLGDWDDDYLSSINKKQDTDE